MEKQIRNEMAHLIADIMRKQNKAHQLEEEIKSDKKKLESLSLEYYTQGVDKNE